MPSSKLREIWEIGYDGLKSSFKAKNDFCVYIEDEKGNVIISQGSAKFNIDGL